MISAGAAQEVNHVLSSVFVANCVITDLYRPVISKIKNTNRLRSAV